MGDEISLYLETHFNYLNRGDRIPLFLETHFNYLMCVNKTYLCVKTQS